MIFLSDGETRMPEIAPFDVFYVVHYSNPVTINKDIEGKYVKSLEYVWVSRYCSMKVN